MSTLGEMIIGNDTQRSYLDIKVQQLTTTVLGVEPVKDTFKAQITLHKHTCNMSRGWLQSQFQCLNMLKSRNPWDLEA